jgi:hypothetical protein
MIVWSKQNEDRSLIAEQVKQWFFKDLGCVFGKREFAGGRYMVAVIEEREDWLAANRAFVEHLNARTASSCLYIPANIQETRRLASVKDVIEHLSQRYLEGLKRPDESVFASKIELLCPVTNQPTIFPDFDLVGFYPHAMQKSDPLYDPSNDAPFVCMNQASDMFGFALMCNDMCRNTHQCKVHELTDIGLQECLLRRAAGKWQELARRTISNFGGRTDPARLLPAHVSADSNFYVTQHDEAAFGESEKLEHFSEMPKLYLDRLITEWLRFFARGDRPRLDFVVRPALCPARIRGASGCPVMHGGGHANENFRGTGQEAVLSA